MQFQTLEEAFFTRQVPGRYSTWEEEEGGKDDKDNKNEKCQDYEMQHCEEDNNHTKQQFFSSSSSPSSHRSAGPQTGVKGVLADHRAHQMALHEQKAQDQAHRHSVLLRIARGASSTSSSSSSASATSSLPCINEEEEEEDEDDDDDDDDQTFLQAYRLQRLHEIKQEKAMPTFGRLQEVSGFEMVDMVNKLQQRSTTTTTTTTKVLVHIHEPHLKACRLVNNCLQVLAQKYPRVCFLSLHQGHHLCPAELQLDEAALPLLLLYEGDKVKECWSQVDALVGGAAFVQEDLDELLAEGGAF